MKSPLPPCPPNPLKRKLATDTLPENIMVGLPDSGVQLVGIPLIENFLAGFNNSVFAYGQIYNEQITYLLDPSQRNLQIREDVKSGVYVENLTEKYVCTMKDVTQLLIKIEETVPASTFVKPSFPLQEKVSTEETKGKTEVRPESLPPPGRGQRIYEIDPTLIGFRQHLDYRYGGGFELFSRGYEKLGFMHSATGITYREWVLRAKSAALIGDFNNWNPNADIVTRNEFGIWEIFLPNNADGSPPIPHGSRVNIRMETPSGIKDSIPAWIKFSVQAPSEIPYNGIYYDPPEEYVGSHLKKRVKLVLEVYKDDVLPRIKKLGYNAVQLMAIQEHSYYASFGHCGTPDGLKSLIDKAHELGLLVLMDIVHSHASNNVLDELNMLDSHYFHSGSRDGKYFGFATDVDAVVYLMLVNDLIHRLFPEAVTIGEDVSGMPTFCIPVEDGGVGFD
ncbi:hypothetical protein Pint_27476 [Pistacia integerrima]|uniref:Uncharacterized protein n=1 Tax=Pistacia integerrima TaxID=434235 RepID=A0ACC0YN59_9ROSI|nr:hypothetical protein Pint_27476 [Pistacia integerrima]